MVGPDVPPGLAFVGASVPEECIGDPVAPSGTAELVMVGWLVPPGVVCAWVGANDPGKGIALEGTWDLPILEGRDGLFVCFFLPPPPPPPDPADGWDVLWCIPPPPPDPADGWDVLWCIPPPPPDPADGWDVLWCIPPPPPDPADGWDVLWCIPPPPPDPVDGWDVLRCIPPAALLTTVGREVAGFAARVGREVLVDGVGFLREDGPVVGRAVCCPGIVLRRRAEGAKV